MADPDLFPELRSVYKTSSRQVNQISQNVAEIKLASEQDGDKENSWFIQGPSHNAWGVPNVIQKLRLQNNSSGSEKGTGNAWPSQDAVSWNSREHGRTQQGEETWGNSFLKSSASEHGWKDPARAGFNSSDNCQDGEVKTDNQVGDNFDNRNGENELDHDECDVVYDSDDLDDFFSDSDEDEQSHEKRKRSKWFNAFFESLDKLTVEEILSPVRQWHCPACQGGPGSINWYRGVQPLMTHAMTKMKRRAKMHRVFTEVLVEEMHRRGTFIKPADDAFGRWEGLNDKVSDHEIVWPPMVIIMNTRYEQDENGKWSGMGNQELLNYFSSYAAVKARHSYGPQGHRGMSVLIFESSAAGYLEAAQLHKHFKDQGRDRNAWDGSPVLFCPGGKRQLYGYLALKEDLDNFNQHSQAKSKLKFEMRSYREMVQSQTKKINDDSQQLIQLKEEVAQEKHHSQALAESLCQLSDKFCQTMNENCIIKQRTILHHEQNTKELAAEEQCFKEKINVIYQSIDSKEDNFEKLHMAARERVNQTNANSTSDKNEYSACEREENSSYTIVLEKKMEEFYAEREKLMKSLQDRKLALTQRYWEELIELEKGFEQELTLLMKKHTPDCLDDEETRPTALEDKIREAQEM